MTCCVPVAFAVTSVRWSLWNTTRELVLRAEPEGRTGVTTILSYCFLGGTRPSALYPTTFDVTCVHLPRADGKPHIVWPESTIFDTSQIGAQRVGGVGGGCASSARHEHATPCPHARGELAALVAGVPRTRKKWLLLLEAKAMAADQAAAAKKPRLLDSPAPSTLAMARQDTAVLLPQPFPRFVGGSPRCCV